MFPDYQNMMPFYQNMTLWPSSPWFMPLISVLVVWDTVWKGIGLWRAGRNNQLGWFIALLVVNSVGILPIVYILFFQRKKEETVIIPKSKVEKKRVKK